MKNFGKLFAIALALLFVVASCEKEGVYNPKQKIDRILSSAKYQEWNDDEYKGWDEEIVEKHVSEVWNWNGNLLTSIDFYDADGSRYSTEQYTYDNKNRLSQIQWTCVDSKYKYEFVYEGKYLANINMYEDGTLVRQIEVAHENGKISQMKLTHIDNFDKSITMVPSIFRIFIPEMDTKTVNNVMKKLNEQKSSETNYLKFEWDGKNIKKVLFIGEDNDEPYYIQEYTYDTKVNPFNKFFSCDGLDEFDTPLMCSQNNVVKKVSKFADEIDADEEIEYTYTYDGNYPSVKSYTETYRGSSYTFIDTYNQYFEYKK